jgi:hypothetical protein
MPICKEYVLSLYALLQNEGEINFQVSSAFRDLVDSSPNFLWKIELAIADKEDGGSHALSRSREMLEQHQRSWADLRWTQEMRLQLTGSSWSLTGSIILQVQENGSLCLKQLPSQSRGVEEREWVVVATQKISNGWKVRIDPAQDLLIIVEKRYRSVFQIRQ